MAVNYYNNDTDEVVLLLILLSTLKTLVKTVFKSKVKSFVSVSACQSCIIKRDLLLIKLFLLHINHTRMARFSFSGTVIVLN